MLWCCCGGGGVVIGTPPPDESFSAITPFSIVSRPLTGCDLGPFTALPYDPSLGNFESNQYKVLFTAPGFDADKRYWIKFTMQRDSSNNPEFHSRTSPGDVYPWVLGMTHISLIDIVVSNECPVMDDNPIVGTAPYADLANTGFFEPAFAGVPTYAEFTSAYAANPTAKYFLLDTDAAWPTDRVVRFTDITFAVVDR